MNKRYSRYFPVFFICFLLLSVNLKQTKNMTSNADSKDIESIQFSLTPQRSFIGETLIIFVENSLWGSSSIKAAVNQYRLDLNKTGYNTILYTNPVANATYLRLLLQSYWYSNQISGAILIGNLPYIQFYHAGSTNFAAETFICDLYLMDLDGQWLDGPTPDGILDMHFPSVGDIEPEIFVGRIDASNRTLGGLTNEQNILSLLNRIHSYRTGGVSRTHRALTYIDDDWQAYANGTYDTWPNWLQNAYPTRADIHTPTTYTNGTDWLNRITQDYEFAHLCVHSGSSPPEHYFGPLGVGEGIVTANQIHSTRPTFNFYNLFNCKGADWNVLDCLATTYLYSSDYSLSIVGTTKTGGMISGSSFYNNLAQNNSIGSSFLNWFQGMTSYSSEYVGWFYGMALFGDPTLQIYYDTTVYEPVISSSTHPDQYNWYADGLPQLNWSVPIDVNGIVGYYYIIDQNPSTVPDQTTGTFTIINGTKVLSSLPDGIWYCHVVGKDGAGNVGKTASHFTLQIDKDAPTVSISYPLNGTTLKPGEITIKWNPYDAGSGYYYAEIRINDYHENTIIHTTTYNRTFSEIGDYTINITVFDLFGLSNSDEIIITIEESTLIPMKYIIIGGSVAGGILLFTVIIIIIRRRKKS